MGGVGVVGPYEVVVYRHEIRSMLEKLSFGRQFEDVQRDLSILFERRMPGWIWKIWNGVGFLCFGNGYCGVDAEDEDELDAAVA